MRVFIEPATQEERKILQKASGMTRQRIRRTLREMYFSQTSLKFPEMPRRYRRSVSRAMTVKTWREREHERN